MRSPRPTGHECCMSVTTIPRTLWHLARPACKRSTSTGRRGSTPTDDRVATITELSGVVTRTHP